MSAGLAAAEVEYFGGPADGRREQVPINPLTGYPPAVRICKMRSSCPGHPDALAEEIFYDRATFRGDGVWVYRMRPGGRG